jgi:hypothetical protein
MILIKKLWSVTCNYISLRRNLIYIRQEQGTWSETLHDVSKLSRCVSFVVELNKVNKMFKYGQFNQFYFNNYINYNGPYKVLWRPRHSSSGYSLASHRGGPGSSPGLVMWDLWWTKWRWGSFLRVLRFPLPIYIPPIVPQSSSSIIWGLHNRPEVVAVPSHKKTFCD